LAPAVLLEMPGKKGLLRLAELHPAHGHNVGSVAFADDPRLG